MSTLNADSSIRSGQEQHDYLPEGDLGVDCQSHSPRSPKSAGADGFAHSSGFTGAPCVQGQVFERPTQTIHDPPEQDPEQLCGWGTLKPRAIQVFNTPQWALFFLFKAAFLQGIVVYGFIGASVTSLERRFDLTSSQIGLIASSYDIASCVCLPFVSYFGGNGHKSRWLGWGVGIMGLGSLVFALPHFTTSSYQVTAPERSDMCSSNSTDFSPNKASDGLSNYFYVFMLGQLLHGIGATPLYTLGFTFLEDNVDSTIAPIYTGIFFTAAQLGPSIGFLLGGYLVSFYSEITLETELTPESPLWVGAWWIGFILGGTLCLPVAFVILAYPKILTGSRGTAVSHQTHLSSSAVHQRKDGSPATASKPPFVEMLKNMLRSLLVLLKNRTYMFLCLAGATSNGINIALVTFMIKYFESQFSLTSTQASLIFGAMATPTTTSGTLLGSYVVKRFKLHCHGIIRFCIASNFASLLLNLILFSNCPTVPMAGVTVPYSEGQREEGSVLSSEHRTLQELNRLLLNDELTSQCNTNCSCDRTQFRPVCGADNVMYYSPCYAGCSSINLTDSGEVYTHCSCVEGNVSQGLDGLAIAGKCQTSCSKMPIIVTVLSIMIVTSFLLTMPAINATLRCVPETQKSFALGIQWIIMRTLGTIPGPIVLGSLLDQTCLLRQSEAQDSCLLYENSQMSHFTLINCVIYRVLGISFFILALIFNKAPPRPLPISAENTDSGSSISLHNKTPPEDGALVKYQTSL